MSNSIEEINATVLKLWKSKDAKVRGNLLPMLLAPIEQNCIVFIGFNPSFPQRYLGGEMEAYFQYRDDITQEEIQRIAEEDKKNFFTYPYFGRMIEIANSLNCKWEHLDLFFLRDRNQRNAENLVLANEGFTDFGAEQFAAFQSALQLSKPQAIVVANAKASHIIKREYKLSKDKSGLYYYCKELSCPMHLGSMLTGQRAMDIYSVERLQAAIELSLEKRK